MGFSLLSNEIEDTIIEGMPVDPLYVHLAAALYRWICTRRFPRNMAPIEGIKEDESWKSRLDAWNETVVTHGSALLEVIDTAQPKLSCFSSPAIKARLHLVFWFSDW